MATLALRIGLVVFGILSVTGCVRSSPAPVAARLTVDFNSEPVTLDPSRVEDGLGIRLMANLMDGLTGFNGQGLLTNRLAESSEVSKDLKTYRFKLRKDARWSDGVAVEPEQFRIGIERALLPKSGSKLSGLLKWIDGAKAFSEGSASRVKGIEIEGNEIVFRLNRPISFFSEVLALPIAYPLRRDVLDANGGAWDPLRGKNVPTNGAYRIRSHIPDRELLLENARPLAKAAPKEVRILFVADEATGATLFEKGELDVLYRIPALDLKRFTEGKRVREEPFGATYFLGFNLKKKPFDRPELRKALAGALKRSELTRALGSGETPAQSWVPPGYEGSFAVAENEKGLDPRFSTAIESAKREGTKREVDLSFDMNARNALVMEKIQADLKAVLGWNVRLKPSEWKPHLRSIYSDPASVFRFGWSSPMRDPALFLLPFASKDPFSFTGYANPVYDRLVDEILETPPSEKRAERIRAAQKILLEDDAVVVPIYHYVSTYAVGPRVAKIRVSPLVAVTLFEEVELRE